MFEKPKIKSLQLFLFGENCPEKQYQAWCSQGFEFGDETVFGLLQRSGGPCGVLSVVQGYIIKNLFFTNRECPKPLCDITAEQRDHAFSTGLMDILLQCAPGKSSFILITPKKGNEFDYETEQVELNQLLARIITLRESISQPGGVVAFIYTCLANKGLDKAREEMDDPSDCFIKRHGYSSQELVNFLLCGSAVSNIFDGTKTLSGDMKLGGISKRSVIGYLTAMESLGYVKAGEFLKTPIYPIWVSATSSHYTTLFSLETFLVDISTLDQLSHKIRLVFTTFDQFESGIIPLEKLPELMSKIDLPEIVKEEVKDNVNKTKETDALLFNFLIAEIKESLRRNEFNVCKHCVSVNAKDITECKECGQKIETEKPKNPQKNEAAIYHYNGITTKTISGSLEKYNLRLDCGFNTESKGETIECIVKTKWVDSELEQIAKKE